MSEAEHNPTQISLQTLIGLGRHARNLQLRATHIHSRLTGNYLSRIKGRGMEFDESRIYQPGDDVRNIDWRVTARTGQTYTKMFREERERPVLISIDNRSCMQFATQGKFKSVIAAEVAALLAWTATQQGDRVGGEIFTDSDHIEFRPRRGKDNILHMFRTLSNTCPPELVAPESLQPAFSRLQRLTHPGSLVCIVSDFHGLDEGAEKALLQIGRHCELLLIHVYDPLEATLPDQGQYRVSLGERILRFNTSNQQFRQQYREKFLHRQTQLEQLSRRGRMKLIGCTTGDSAFQVLFNSIGKQRSHQRRAG